MNKRVFLAIEHLGIQKVFFALRLETGLNLGIFCFVLGVGEENAA